MEPFISLRRRVTRLARLLSIFYLSLNLITSGGVKAVCTAYSPSITVSEAKIAYWTGQGPLPLTADVAYQEPAGSTGCTFQLEVVFVNGHASYPGRLAGTTAGQ